jgi:hypothetical protein
MKDTPFFKYSAKTLSSTSKISPLLRNETSPLLEAKPTPNYESLAKKPRVAKKNILATAFLPSGSQSSKLIEDKLAESEDSEDQVENYLFPSGKRKSASKNPFAFEDEERKLSNNHFPSSSGKLSQLGDTNGPKAVKCQSCAFVEGASNVFALFLVLFPSLMLIGSLYLAYTIKYQNWYMSCELHDSFIDCVSPNLFRNSFVRNQLLIGIDRSSSHFPPETVDFNSSIVFMLQQQQDSELFELQTYDLPNIDNFIRNSQERTFLYPLPQVEIENLYFRTFHEIREFVRFSFSPEFSPFITSFKMTGSSLSDCYKIIMNSTAVFLLVFEMILFVYLSRETYSAAVWEFNSFQEKIAFNKQTLFKFKHFILPEQIYCLLMLFFSILLLNPVGSGLATMFSLFPSSEFVLSKNFFFSLCVIKSFGKYGKFW